MHHSADVMLDCARRTRLAARATVLSADDAELQWQAAQLAALSEMCSLSRAPSFSFSHKLTNSLCIFGGCEGSCVVQSLLQIVLCSRVVELCLVVVFVGVGGACGTVVVFLQCLKCFVH